VERSG